MVFSYFTRFFNYQSYLERYGYLSPTDVKFGRVKSKWKLYQAVRNLQRFTGLNETGNPEDPNTIELVTRHRCGFRDLGKTAQFRRKKRYSLHGTFWHKNVSFFSFSNDSLDSGWGNRNDGNKNIPSPNLK